MKCLYEYMEHSLKPSDGQGFTVPSTARFLREFQGWGPGAAEHSICLCALL